jgi:tol-pal system protein YbgF
MSGCLAQKADLTRLNQEVDLKIAKLDEAIKRANEAGAQLHQDVSELRDEEVAALRGGLDKGTHEQTSIRAKLDDLEHRLGKLNAGLQAANAGVASATKTLEARLQEHDKALAEDDAQRQALGQQVVQLGGALAEFKLAINGLGEKLIQQDQRVADFNAEASRRMDTLREKIEADAQATTAHLAEVNKSVTSVAKALETVGGKFVAQEEQQDRRLDEMNVGLQALTKHVTALTQAVNQMDESVQSVEAVRSRVEELAQAVSQLQETKNPTGNKSGGKKPAQSSSPPSAAKESHRAERPRRSSEAGSRSAPGEAAAPAAASDPGAPPEAVHETAGASAQAATLAARTAASAGAQIEAAAGAKEAYDRNIQKFKQGDLNGALQGFSDFLAQHPTSDLAPNAQYWQGECYYGRKEYELAIEAFDRVKLSYPTSEKVPAALLKKGFAYLALKDQRRASATLRQVVDAYPKSPEASKALDKLAQLKQKNR